MAMNPIETTRNIEVDYTNYLKSILTVRDKELTDKIHDALSEGQFVNGPYLEATPPFSLAATLEELMNQQVIDSDFDKIAAEAEIYRPLYVHQEEAIRKVSAEGRNIIVSTGTGSGKTECFIYPIVNELMRQNRNGSLTPGVRALLLYPMNALANDQMKRLRHLLKNYPEISFGRYTGETIEGENKARELYREKREREIKGKNPFAVKGVDYTDQDLNPLNNELISRETMRDQPPHILLTNYAMLEYLLIRPEDTELFDGPSANAWRFIVLDEAHTYKGSNGTEIALLLRRLKERVCQNKRGVIQCIATSATLGNREALPELATFASTIFDEHFDVTDIIQAQRKRHESLSNASTFSLNDYTGFKKSIRTMESDEAEKWLYEKLSIDTRITNTLRMLETKPRSLRDVAEYVFADCTNPVDRLRAQITLIELGAKARPDTESSALIPARYHLFVRALEGVYVALYPRKKAFLDRRKRIFTDGYEVPVFELANCQHCGQEYIVGKELNAYLNPVTDQEKPDYFMLTNEVIDEEELVADGDDEALEAPDVKKVQPYELCTRCGRLQPAGSKVREVCCEGTDGRKIIRVYKMVARTREINTCAMCGSVQGAVIKRFMTANQPATYIIANSLYSMIPPQRTDAKDDSCTEDDLFDFGNTTFDQTFYDESGRKLLVFSDNRQEAAFFAAYMDNKYNQLMWRRLILRELRKRPDGFVLSDLVPLLVKRAKEAALYSGTDLSSVEKENIAWTYLLKEYIGHERNQGLEGRGYVRFAPEEIVLKNGRWGLSKEEVVTLFSMVMDTLRYSGVTIYPDNIDPEDEVFEPRNRESFFRKEGSEKKRSIVSFVPVGSSSNKRFDYVKKILAAKGFDEDTCKIRAYEILSEIYDGMLMPLVSRGYFVQKHDRMDGVLHQINYKKWHIKYIQDADVIYQCARCGKITTHNISDVCPEYRCSGKLESITAKDFRQDPYYSKQFEEEKLIPMISREHTAQLDKDTAGTVQTKFENGEVNVLSCSTTFEMGVDVGQLEAILLRNMPPETANYIQRAGRAGRRTSSTAFSVTFAKRSSHDLYYYRNPGEMISGKIKTPYIEVSNEKIAQRHVNSIVLAWFFRRRRDYFDGKLRALSGLDGRETVITALAAELAEKPAELIDSIGRVLDKALMERLDIRSWGFVDKLIGDNGTLTNAIEEKRRDLAHLHELYNEKIVSTKLFKAAGDIAKLINTLEEQKSITFLASSGVIPKYGFPVDVVKLDILNNSAEASQVDLSRDLKMAVAEYAPGSEVIAAGRVWKSHSINRIRDKEWRTYVYYECPICGYSTMADGVTTLEETETGKSWPCVCGRTMKEHRFIIPEFGFSTMRTEKAKRVGDSRPKHFYATKVQFSGFDPLDPYQVAERKEADIRIADKLIGAVYSPQGKLVVLNRGSRDAGLFICKLCGYAQTTPTDFAHKNKTGNDCPNRYATNAALGHIFLSDILRLEFPYRAVREIPEHDLNITLLYALLEGASDALGISRDDINGCIDRSGSLPAIILYDEASGGAGHVKQIYRHLDTVLRAAYQRVDGRCGCGEETCCYGCLMHYGNQPYHEIMARGLAREYLEWLIMDTVAVQAVYLERSAAGQLAPRDGSSMKTPVNEDWKSVLRLLTGTEEDDCYRFAMRLIESGIEKAPDEVGYELSSTQYGVLGYEAEMVWHDKNVAVLRDDVDTDAVNRFEENGWTVFGIRIEDLTPVIEALR